MTRLPVGHADPLDREAAREWSASGIGAASNGARSGLRMAPGERVEPIASAPARVRIERYLRLGAGERLADALVRAGAAPGEAARAEALVAGASPKLAPGTALTLVLGASDPAGRRAIERLALRGGLERDLVISRGGDGSLGITVRALAVDRTPLRLTGQAGDGLYFALRAAGVPAAAAADYLKAIAEHVDVGAVGAADRFDLVFAHRQAAGAEGELGPLLYAGLLPASGAAVQLLRWKSGSDVRWMQSGELSGEAPRAAGGAIWPVRGPITSTFGARRHPILHFWRPHRGIDFGAASGTPIVAAADGVVSRAGWAGGYGRQVRIAHAQGMGSSYSHMSAIAVAPGSSVRQGQVIGYVGSSGLSTGPHLHYEVYRGGVAVDPMGARFAASTPVVNPGEARAFKARLAQMLALPARTGS